LFQLDEPHREAFILYYYFDVPLNEIAGMLRVNNGTIKSRLYHARQKIRKLLDANRTITMEASNE
jgi:RNA polymerase sigma-70 factor (ECF subfamily)